MFSKLILIVATAILLAKTAYSTKPTNSSSSEWKCTPGDKDKIDAVIAQIMTYNWHGRNFPRNQQELKPYCRETMTLLGRADDYKVQCLRAEAKQFVSLFLYSVRQSFNSYCRHPGGQKTRAFYRSASCFNAAVPSFNSCRHIYSDILTAIETNRTIESHDKLPQLCCGYFKSLECIRERLSAKRGCNETDGEVMTDYLNGVYEDAINAMCHDYSEDSDRCASVKLFTIVGNKNSTNSTRPSHFNQAVNVFTNL